MFLFHGICFLKPTECYVFEFQMLLAHQNQASHGPLMNKRFFHRYNIYPKLPAQSNHQSTKHVLIGSFKSPGHKMPEAKKLTKLTIIN